MRAEWTTFIEEVPWGLCSVDERYIIVDHNKAFQRIFNINPKQSLIGLSFNDFVNWASPAKITGFFDVLDIGPLDLHPEWEVSYMKQHDEYPLILWGNKNHGNYYLVVRPVAVDQVNFQNVLMGINTEMTNLHRELNRKQSQLQTAHSKIKEVNQHLKEKNKIMEKDLLMAQIVQKSLLSKIVNHYDKVQLTSTYTPAETVGGDLYDMLVLDEHHVGIFICDVTGHGVAAALVMAVIKNIFRTHAPHYRLPHELLDVTNKEFMSLFEDTASDLYATAFYVILNLKEDTLYYAGAGHPSPELYHKDEPSESLYDPSFPIGIFNHDTYSSKSLPIKDGDRLFLYTDGIESYLADNKDYLYDLKKFSWGNIVTCFNDLSLKVNDGSDRKSDDICMLIVEYNPL